MSEAFFSRHQPYVCRCLKVFAFENFCERNFPSIQILPQAKWENFPGQRNLQRFPLKFHLQPLETGSFACFFLRFYQIHHSFGRARRAISVCRHWGPDSSSKNPRCWLMISSSLQGSRYQQLFQDLSWRYVVTQKMGNDRIDQVPLFSGPKKFGVMILLKWFTWWSDCKYIHGFFCEAQWASGVNEFEFRSSRWDALHLKNDVLSNTSIKDPSIQIYFL